MKTVFDNRMVAHVWAQRNQEHGKSHNGQFFFEGDTIYSYGRHFPIASWVAHDLVIFCEQSYSVTTSNHQSMVLQALMGSTYVIRVPDSKIMDYHDKLSPDNDHDVREGARMLIEGMYTEAVQPLIKSAAKRRKASLSDSDLSEAGQLLHYCARLFDHYGVSMSKEIKKLWHDLEHDRTTLMSTKKAEIDADRERMRKAKAERDARDKEDLEKAINDFRAGVHYNHGIIRRAPVMLRVNGENIETSHGASFPVTNAIKCFKFIRYIRDKGEAYDRRDMAAPKPTNEAFKLGHFSIDRIDSRGNVVAGCHSVKWEQIEHCARALNIYP